MFLDHPNRRVWKVTPSATHIYLYDGWNLVREVQWPVASGQWPVGPLATSHYPLVTDYIWGKDLSGTLSGAGGVGGLLAVAVTDCPATNSPTPNSSLVTRHSISLSTTPTATSPPTSPRPAR